MCVFTKANNERERVDKMEKRQHRKVRLRKKRRKMLLSGILILSMLLGMQSVFVSAGDWEDPSLCVHHPVHTAECGYVEGSEGTLCTYEHTAECYQEVTACIHEHDDACGAITAEGTIDDALCNHVCTAESGCITSQLVCDHANGIHDETCGYTAATEGVPCGYVCKICLVQSVIDALPNKAELTEMSDEELKDVQKTLDTLQEAMESLGEDADQIDDAQLKETAAWMAEFGSVSGKDADTAGNSGETTSNTTQTQPLLGGTQETVTPSYTYDENTKTLTITVPEGKTGIVGMEIKNESDYNSWKTNVTKIIIEGNITAFEGDQYDENENMFNESGEFESWKNLESVEYKGNTPFTVGDAVFYKCSNLKTFPFEYVSSTTNLSFAQTGFERINLSGIKGNIGKSAFYNIESLTELKINVVGEDILFDDESFSAYYSGNSPLKSIEISGSGSLFLGPQTVDQSLGNAFSYHENLKTVDFSNYEGKVSFGNSAFAGDSSLEEINMGDNAEITYIGTTCFFGCALDKTVLDTFTKKITGTISWMGFVLPSGDTSPNPIDNNNSRKP